MAILGAEQGLPFGRYADNPSGGSDGGLPPHELDAPKILQTIYGESAIYPDVVNTEEGVGRMIVTPDRAGRAEELLLDYSGGDGNEADGQVTITEDHAEGHFTPESGLPFILPGHKHIRLAMETAKVMVGMRMDESEEAPQPHVRLRGFDVVTFMGAIKPGDVVDVKTQFLDAEGPYLRADAQLLVNGEVKTIIGGLIVEQIEEELDDTMLEDQMIEFAAQSAAVEIFAAQPEKRPLFGGIGRTRFTGMEIKAGDSLTAMVQDVEYDGKRRFAGNSVIVDQDGNLVGEVADMQATIASQALLKRALGVT